MYVCKLTSMLLTPLCGDVTIFIGTNSNILHSSVLDLEYLFSVVVKYLSVVSIDFYDCQQESNTSYLEWSSLLK